MNRLRGSGAGPPRAVNPAQTPIQIVFPGAPRGLAATAGDGTVSLSQQAAEKQKNNSNLGEHREAAKETAPKPPKQGVSDNYQ